jgi:hypothetical protein
MEFLMGIAGAVLAFALFFLGVCLGWHFCEKYSRRVTAEKLTEEQERELRAEAEAWKCLHNYSVEDAYQIQHRSKE